MALTQWITPAAFASSPSRVTRSSCGSPFAPAITSSQRTIPAPRSRTAPPGVSRLKPFGGFALKSSCSMKSSRVSGTSRTACSGSTRSPEGRATLPSLLSRITSCGQYGSFSSFSPSRLVIVTLSGRVTAITRTERALRSSRTVFSKVAMSTVRFVRLTLICEANARIASGVIPRRRCALSVGIRGSSQPFTTPSFTSRRSFRLLTTVYSRLRRPNSYWRGGVFPVFSAGNRLSISQS